MANTSVPSITAPPRTVKPMPAPRKNPPNRATNKLSCVTSGNCTVATTSANPVIASRVLIANAFPMILYPSMIKGMLIPINNRYNGKGVKAEINKEMPVAPPSIKWLERRNPLNPNAAEKIPSVMKKKSLVCRLKVRFTVCNRFYIIKWISKFCFYWGITDPWFRLKLHRKSHIFCQVII